MKIRTLMIVALVFLVGCEAKKPADSPPPPDTKVEVEPEIKTEEPKGWQPKTLAELNPKQREQLALAQESQKALGGQLMKMMGTTVKEKGLVAGIEVCNTNAPEISAEVAKTKGIQIGRTSSKLRNPKNHGPDWMKDVVTKSESKAVILAGPKGELGWAAPITANEMCVKCHGDETTMSPDVKDPIAKYYPEDKAKGYKVGDLRGWFWVEVKS